LLIAISSVAALSQTQMPAERAEFEVASIKPSAGGKERFESSKSPGTFHAGNMLLRALISQAYGVRDFQIYGGPGWIDSDGYDIDAKREVAPQEDGLFDRGKIWADLNLRLRALLEDRCNLRVHRETKELPVYVLTVAKSGLKLQPPSCVTVDPNNPSPTLEPGKSRPAYCGNDDISRDGLRSTYSGTGITMKSLVERLTNAMGRTVLDKTGYTEQFNATVQWTRDDPPGPSDPDSSNPVPPVNASGPSVFIAALQQQLGLKLESAKGPVEVLVIDHIEKPSAN